MRINRSVSVILLFVALCFAFGCAGKKHEIVPATASDRPAWVDKAGGAFPGDGQRVIYGVGSHWGGQNPSLQRSAAGNKARAEVAKFFMTYTAALMKIYEAHTMEGTPEASSEEQHVEQAIRTFTKAELAGVQIVDHYRDPETGELFALARMDLNTFEDLLKQGQALSQAARERVIRNAEKAFDELARQEAMHR